MDHYPYAGRELEKALKLQITPLQREHEKKLIQFRMKLQRIVDRIGGDVPELAVPKRILARELDKDQRILLNEALTLPYAERNVMQQQALKEVLIQEADPPEHMVPLAPVFEERGLTATFSTNEIHAACGEWAKKERVFWLRARVAEKVALVCEGLNAVDLMPHIEDCWRHEEVQRGLYIRRIIDFAQRYEEYEWDWQQVRMAARSFTASSPGLAGHMAGAAVDFRAREQKGEKAFLPLGNDYPEGGAACSIDFPYITLEEWETRTLFTVVARLAGLKLLPTEDWHASHGDRGLGMDGTVRMLQAIYGPVQDFDPASGAVVLYPATARREDEFLDDWTIEELVDLARRRKDPADIRPNEYPYQLTVVELANQARELMGIRTRT